MLVTKGEKHSITAEFPIPTLPTLTLQQSILRFIVAYVLKTRIHHLCSCMLYLVAQPFPERLQQCSVWYFYTVIWKKILKHMVRKIYFCFFFIFLKISSEKKHTYFSNDNNYNNNTVCLSH